MVAYVLAQNRYRAIGEHVCFCIYWNMTVLRSISYNTIHIYFTAYWNIIQRILTKVDSIRCFDMFTALVSRSMAIDWTQFDKKNPWRFWTILRWQLAFHGVSWHLSHISWCSMELHGILLRLKMSWGSIGFSSSELHKIPCDFGIFRKWVSKKKIYP